MLKIPLFFNKFRSRIDVWQRLVFASVALALVYFWYSGMMLHHVWDSPFNYKGADISYWLYSSTKLTKIILASEQSALVFSFILIGLFIANVIWVKQPLLSILAGVCLLIYQIQFNMKIGYHTHHLFGFQFALFPFYVPQVTFPAALALARILTCLAYFFAGFFKLYHGAWLYIDSYANVLKNQHAAWYYFHQTGWRTDATLYMIEHPMLGWGLFMSAMLMQLSFAVGLITKRFNVWLALGIVLFHIMDWFLMNLGVFMGMTVLVWLLLYQAPKSAEKC
ncbi:MAG: hypothetical protein ACKOXF_12305 [Chitinophagaceae bacterium]